MTDVKLRVNNMKAGMAYVPAPPLIEVGAAMQEGAMKYNPYNWRSENISFTTYYAAAMRHLMAAFCGEDTDPDSGLPHVTKAIASLLILRDAQMHNLVNDDRSHCAGVYQEVQRFMNHRIKEMANDVG